jgi:hypothetical protein
VTCESFLFAKLTFKPTPKVAVTLTQEKMRKPQAGSLAHQLPLSGQLLKKEKKQQAAL